jgi:hypothetical protein
MPRKPSFNFGDNAKSKKSKASKKRRKKSGKRSNAWGAYTSSNAPIPD